MIHRSGPSVCTIIHLSTARVSVSVFPSMIILLFTPWCAFEFGGVLSFPSVIFCFHGVTVKYQIQEFSVSFSFRGSWFQEIEYNSVIVRSSVAWNFYASIRLINLKKKITITRKIFMKFLKIQEAKCNLTGHILGLLSDWRLTRSLTLGSGENSQLIS